MYYLVAALIAAGVLFLLKGLVTAVRTGELKKIGGGGVKARKDDPSGFWAAIAFEALYLLAGVWLVLYLIAPEMFSISAD
ncbi:MULTISPECIES: hypothetical protein [Kordiimonas]|jgi:hypothetical protein|uniref:hypothetical protein n=1 Tax=Kordiimonas TaxID=288021 RepID=UPI00257F1A6B|nr:hypothetical protein [Kordiimonas sp. UBA4487]